MSEIRGLYRSQFFWGLKMTRISKSAFILASGVISWKIEMHLNLAMMTHFPCLVPMQENYHFGEIIEISDLKEKASLTSISKDMTLV